MTNKECWDLSGDGRCTLCPYRGGKPGCIRLKPEQISEEGIDRLLNGIHARAIKDFMIGFKYTHCRKEPKMPIARKEPAEGATAKVRWKYHTSMIRFKKRYGRYKLWHERHKNMVDAEKYFRSDEFASITNGQYNPDAIIKRMKLSIRHMSYKNIENATRVRVEI